MTNEKISVEPLVLTKEYSAPRALVFDCWTKSEHLCNWQFPMPGFRCEFLQDDIKVGGSDRQDDHAKRWGNVLAH